MNKDALIRIVDDEADVREALQLMLEIEGWKTVAYDSAQSFLVNDNHRTPGCLLLDVRMPGKSGLALQQIMQQRHIDLPIIFLTGHADINVAIASLKKGARDFLLKPVDTQKLLEAIEQTISYDEKRRAGIDGMQRIREGLKLLSERETEILTFFLQGLSDRIVAERLQLSERTVQGHRARIYEKFRVHTARELKLLYDDIRTCIEESENAI